MKKRWLILLCACLVLAFISALYFVASAQTPDFREMKQSTLLKTKTRGGSPSTRRVGPQTPGWVPISQISPFLVRAIIASEDTSFFSHDGVDFHEIKEAIKKDLKERRYARGASTITQQLIKNLYLSKEKSLWRKVKEFFWARKMEKLLTKNEILNYYLNIIEWGPGIYGIQEAAYYYFGTPPASLSAKQSAFLAMLVPSPRKYHDAYYLKQEISPWAQKRMAKILRVMYRMQFIDEGIYKEALSTSLFGEPVDEGAFGDTEIANKPTDPDPPTSDDELGSESEGTPAPSPENAEPTPSTEKSDESAKPVEGGPSQPNEVPEKEADSSPGEV